MVKKVNQADEDDFDDEEEFEEEDPDFEEEVKQPQKKPIEVERTNKFAEKPKQQPENRFIALHSPQIDGIMDKVSGKLFSADIMEILADIKSQLNRIEESLG